MRKAIVFGLGNTFKCYKDEIYSRYNVVGVTDNNLKPDEYVNFVMPNSLPIDSNTSIVVCVKNDYLSVFKQLINHGVPKQNIVNINEFASEERITQWEMDGKPIPPISEYKRNVIKSFAEKYNCNTLIETGTYYGGTIEALLPYFGCIVSVELSRELYDKAVRKFEGISFVRLYHGDSGTLLEDIICANHAEKNSIFWLDGHYSGGETACGENETPIMRELFAIQKYCESGVILIDDARCFDGSNDYPTIEKVESFINENYCIKQMEVEMDIIRIVFSKSV